MKKHSTPAAKPQEFALRDGESLADFVNRNRPVKAPKVEGSPVWLKDEGRMAWRVAGWTIFLDPCENGQTDEGFAVLWDRKQDSFYYALEASGERRTITYDDPWELAGKGGVQCRA